MLELSCQRVVKKKASFIYYSEFLALQKSSGEKKEFWAQKKTLQKSESSIFWAPADFLFSQGRMDWIQHC